MNYHKYIVFNITNKFKLSISIYKYIIYCCKYVLNSIKSNVDS